MRGYERAREIDVESKELVARALDLGIEVKTASSGLSDDDAEILKLETHVYYIGRQNNDPNNPPALFRKRLRQGVLVSEELVDSVESMQVSYGEDTDNDTAVDIYGKADMVTDWSRVATLRVGLLVRTPHNVDTELDRATYVFDGATLGPFNDNRQRRVFTSTVSLRN